MQYTRPGLLSAESGWEVKRHLKIPVRSRCTVRLKWCSCSILEITIGCSNILSVLYCAGSATGGKGGRIKYLVLKGERVKVELYQWRQLSHDRLYITSVLSINLRIVAFSQNVIRKYDGVSNLVLCKLLVQNYIIKNFIAFTVDYTESWHLSVAILKHIYYLCIKSFPVFWSSKKVSTWRWVKRNGDTSPT